MVFKKPTVLRIILVWVGNDGSAVRLAFPQCRRGHRKKRKEPSAPALPHGEHDFTRSKQGDNTRPLQRWLVCGVYTNGNTLVTTLRCHFQVASDVEGRSQYTSDEECIYSCQKHRWPLVSIPTRNRCTGEAHRHCQSPRPGTDYCPASTVWMASAKQILHMHGWPWQRVHVACLASLIAEDGSNSIQPWRFR